LTKWCEQEFQKIKELLKTNTILKVPDMDQDFLFCMDSSKKGLGGVLMQEGRVIPYTLGKIWPHEEYYVTHDLELNVIVHVLWIQRHYLVGRKI
jgi:hypothetical protein